MPKTKSGSKSKAMKKADRYFSKYIRLRDANQDGICKCVTCGQFHHWKSIHAGHFIKRDKQSTRYDERNVHAQCVRCNTFREGEQYEHYKFIRDKYGEETVEELERKGKQITKRTKADFELLAEYYKEQAKIIAKEKGIEL